MISSYPIGYFHNVGETDLPQLEDYVRNIACPDIAPDLLASACSAVAAVGRRALSPDQRQVYGRYRLAVRAWYTAAKSRPSDPAADRARQVAAMKAWAHVPDPLGFQSWTYIAAEEFDPLIAGHAWVLLAFVSSGCIASRMMDAALETTRQRFSKTLVCRVASRSRAPELARRLAIRGVPTFLLFKDGGLKSAQRGGGLASTEWLEALDEVVPMDRRGS